MKEKLYILFLATALFTACDPITEDGHGPQVISADSFEGSVTPVVVDGKNTNRVVCKTTSPVTCQWTDGITTLTSNNGTIDLFVTGEQKITCTAMNQDGSTFTKEYTVNVETMTYEVDPTYGYFCGNGSKTWVWNSTANSDGYIWGNGSRNSDTGPTWWGRTVDDIDLEEAYNNYGANASMTFTLNGLKFEKSSADGSQHESGTFSFAMNSDQTAWSKGTLSISGTTILMGVSQNDDKKVVYDFMILHIDAETLVLAYNTESNDYETWYWMFKAK